MSSVVASFLQLCDAEHQQGRAGWSAFYHQNVKSSFRFREDFTSGRGNSYVFGSQDDSELAIGQVGGSFAVSTAKGAISVSGSISRSFASLNSRSRQFTLVDNSLGRSQSLFLDTVDDSSQTWTLALGIRAQPTNYISVGGVFRSGSTFELELEDQMDLLR